MSVRVGCKSAEWSAVIPARWTLVKGVLQCPRASVRFEMTDCTLHTKRAAQVHVPVCLNTPPYLYWLQSPLAVHSSSHLTHLSDLIGGTKGQRKSYLSRISHVFCQFHYSSQLQSLACTHAQVKCKFLFLLHRQSTLCRSHSGRDVSVGQDYHDKQKKRVAPLSTSARSSRDKRG